MIYHFYVVFNKRGASRTAKKRPTLGSGEIAIKMRVDMPRTAFEQWSPEVAITIPESALIVPPPVVTVLSPSE